MAISGVVGAWNRVALYAVSPSKPSAKSNTPGSPDVVILVARIEDESRNGVVMAGRVAGVLAVELA